MHLAYVVLYLALACFAIADLSICGWNGDTYGTWKRTADLEKAPEEKAQVEQRYILGGPGEGMWFTLIWVPTNCLTHRFTNFSTYSFVNHILEKSGKNSSEPLRIHFLGDSGTRGVFCGITRILSGSEYHGPCVNPVCGTPGTLPTSFKSLHQTIEVNFGPKLQLFFTYLKTLGTKHADWMIENAVKSKPYAVIVNTGAWDFDHLARQQRGKNHAETCNSTETEEISKERASNQVKKMMLEIGKAAEKDNVKVIYRNNHYNHRFGANCADDRVEEMLQGSAWKIWDNRRISKDVWEEQDYDGFHFDRHKVHTFVHHVMHMKFWKNKGWELPGMLEITLAQSLLLNLFHQEVEYFYNNKLAIGHDNVEVSDGLH